MRVWFVCLWRQAACPSASRAWVESCARETAPCWRSRSHSGLCWKRRDWHAWNDLSRKQKLNPCRSLGPRHEHTHSTWAHPTQQGMFHLIGSPHDWLYLTDFNSHQSNMSLIREVKGLWKTMVKITAARSEIVYTYKKIENKLSRLRDVSLSDHCCVLYVILKSWVMLVSHCCDSAATWWILKLEPKF